MSFRRDTFCTVRACAGCGHKEESVDVWLDRIMWQEKRTSALYYVKKADGELDTILVELPSEKVDKSADPALELRYLMLAELEKRYPAIPQLAVEAAAAMDV